MKIVVTNDVLNSNYRYNFRQITFARRYRCKTKQWLADSLKVKYSDIVAFEKGLKTPTFEELNKISYILDFPIGFFELKFNANSISKNQDR